MNLSLNKKKHVFVFIFLFICRAEEQNHDSGLMALAILPCVVINMPIIRINQPTLLILLLEGRFTEFLLSSWFVSGVISL